jgi:hypothetical protein
VWGGPAALEDALSSVLSMSGARKGLSSAPQDMPDALPGAPAVLRRVSPSMPDGLPGAPGVLPEALPGALSGAATPAVPRAAAEPVTAGPP